MKVRILWAAPGGPLVCGEVYDLADGEALVASGDAEKAPRGANALPDPRPAPEPVDVIEAPEASDAPEA
ncbi:MAG: hypothetical protein LW695_08890 [Phenylobacterium sp.]|nr:hypothetical protein [Phenylobacterium sp.]